MDEKLPGKKQKTILTSQKPMNPSLSLPQAILTFLSCYRVAFDSPSHAASTI